MTGVAALLHLDRRTVDQAVLYDLVRGPESASACIVEVWSNGPVGLAVGTLRDDLGSQSSPQVASNGGLVAVWCGRLDNHREIFDRLGQPERAASVAALLLSAFERWGAGCLNMFAGDFAFIICDVKARRLFAGRDQLGIRPLHYATGTWTSYIASRTDCLRRQPGVGNRINERTIGTFLLGNLDSTATFFDGISRVPAGHVLEMTGEGRTALSRYWEPDPQRIIRYANDSDYIEAFGQLFRRAVESRLPPAQRAGLLLSGGLDSMAVLWTIAQLDREKGLLRDRLATFTATFDEIDDKTRGVADTADTISVDRCVVVGEPSWTVDASDSEEPAWDEPLEGMYGVTVERLLECAHKRNVAVLLTGYGGDLALSGNYYYLFNLLISRRWSTLERELSSYPIRRRAELVLRYLVRPLVLRRPAHKRCCAIPGWIAKQFAARTDLRSYIRPELPRYGRLASISLRAEIDAIKLPQHATRMLWQQSAALRHGIDLRHPFLDLRLFEFLLAVPAEQKIQNGRSKALLRRAIPKLVALTYGSEPVTRCEHPASRSLREREKINWESCFAKARSADLGYIHLPALQQAFKTYLDGNLSLKYTLARVYRLEKWLKKICRVAQI